MRRLCHAAQIFLPVLLLASIAGATTLHVAPGVQDSSQDGSEAHPFTTLEAARNAIRALKQKGAGTGEGTTVLIAPGVYTQASFKLQEEDSGTAEAPIVYRGAGREATRLRGGLALSEFASVDDTATAERFDEAARAHIRVADLAAAGVTDFGTLKRRGFGSGAAPMPLELFFNGQPMTLARWPNDDFVHIAGVPDGADSGKFLYEGERPNRWKQLEDIWVHGYWTWDWADSYEKVASLDRAKREITTVAPHGVYGYKEKARYYFLNVLDELDAPGEYYVDRAGGKLYFWPPAAVEGAEIAVSLVEEPLIVAEEVSHVRFEHLTLEYSRGNGVVMTGGEGNTLGGLRVWNLGGDGITISGGKGHTVDGCDLTNLGYGGISLGGGNRQTLVPGGHAAVNNHIHHFSRAVNTYTPGIGISGVGNRIAHNHIHDAPHMAIGLSGNDHIIEFNDIHHVCMITHDAGAFYMGRNWSERGVVVRHNYFHELGNGDVQAVYLDDWASGVHVYGNVCHGARRGVLIGGGRDNVIENNIFVDCPTAVHIDQRGLGWAKTYFDGTTTTLFDRMKEVNADQPPYTDRYPALKTLLADEPVLAKYNRIERNIIFNSKFLDLLNDLTPETPYLTIKDNWTEGEPGFVDAGNMNYRLKEDAPAVGIGFDPIPWENIGIQGGGYR